jgi:Signal transduction histidine kinase
LAYPDPKYREEVEDAWYEQLRKARLEGEDSVVLQVLIHTKNLGDRWYEVKSSIADPIQMVAFIDIHQVKSQEENLKRLNENRDRILSILGHDLRGPISHLHALSKMALNKQISHDDFAKMIREVNVKAFQTNEFLSTSLAWAKSNFDAIQIRYETVPLKNLVDELLLLYSDIIENKKVKVRIDITPEFTLKADREIMITILRNLFSNALKFSYEGGTITIGAHADGKTTIVEVSDQGMGMDAQKVESISKNQYSSGIGTYGEKGLGIGIMLCKDLLNRMNAELKVESTAGVGTTMKIVVREIKE